MYDQNIYRNHMLYGQDRYFGDGAIITQPNQNWNSSWVSGYAPPWCNSSIPAHQPYNQYDSTKIVENVDHSTYVGNSITSAGLAIPYPLNNYNLLNENSGTGSKILVNPHFKKNVHINPNFKKHDKTPQPMNIHINPAAPVSLNKIEVKKVNNIHLNPSRNVQSQPFDRHSGRGTSNNIHVNPRILKTEFRNVKPENKNTPSKPAMFHNNLDESLQKPIVKTNKNEAVYKSKNKLIRVPVKRGVSDSSNSTSVNKVRRNSVKSRYKIQRTVSIQKRKNSVLSKYKIVKANCSGSGISPGESKLTGMKTISPKSKFNLVQTRYKIIKSGSPKKPYSGLGTKQANKLQYPVANTTISQKNQFHVDNRSKRVSKRTIDKRTRYVYVDKFYNITNLAKNMLIKQGLSSSKPGYVKINGILYKKSPNSMRKANLERNGGDLAANSSTPKLHSSKSLKPLRTTKLVKISPSKLRKSNVPCSMYRKFGRCGGKDNGKCIKIHNPKHIVLCTKFLQGACVNKNCLLSHEISPEKMPTCKYFLEGSCSRDDCQYLHVKISPKADICLDFLQGFCKNATECDRRHQFLCPDYEKHGKCPRKRCSFPHGERVRKINNFRKNTKKYSGNAGAKITVPKYIAEANESCNKIADEKCSSSRYYENAQFTPQDLLPTSSNNEVSNIQPHTDKCFRNRPKLGALPSYIPLIENQS